MKKPIKLGVMCQGHFKAEIWQFYSEGLQSKAFIKVLGGSVTPICGSESVSKISIHSKYIKQFSDFSCTLYYKEQSRSAQSDSDKDSLHITTALPATQRQCCTAKLAFSKSVLFA